MEDNKYSLYECKHCDQTGTCTTGKDGVSCMACVKAFKLKKNQTYIGLVCSSCGGIGVNDHLTERMNKRTRPIVAISLLVFVTISCVALAFMNSPNFSAYLAFSSTLSASIVTYYFSNNKK